MLGLFKAWMLQVLAVLVAERCGCAKLGERVIILPTRREFREKLGRVRWAAGRVFPTLKKMGEEPAA